MFPSGKYLFNVGGSSQQHACAKLRHVRDHATHKQAGFRTGASPPLSCFMARSCTLTLLFKDVWCQVRTWRSSLFAQWRHSLANQWPAACLRHTKVSVQLSWNLDRGETKKVHFGARNVKRQVQLVLSVEKGWERQPSLFIVVPRLIVSYKRVT